METSTWKNKSKDSSFYNESFWKTVVMIIPHIFYVAPKFWVLITIFVACLYVVPQIIINFLANSFLTLGHAHPCESQDIRAHAPGRLYACVFTSLYETQNGHSRVCVITASEQLPARADLNSVNNVLSDTLEGQ
jgi:hypothetical protein